MVPGYWIQDPGHTSGIVTGVTFDGGATWEPVVIPDSRCTGGDIEFFAGDPWLAFAANGDLYSVALLLEDFSFDRAAIHINKSVDGGRSWAAPVSLVEGLGHDKPSITADPEDPCAVYAGWTQFADGGDLILLSRTTDCGQTWTEPQTLYSGPPTLSWFQLVVLPKGTVLAFFKVPRVGSVYVKRSTDAGETWFDEPTVIADTGLLSKPLTPDGDMIIRGSGNFDVAVDRKTGYLATVWEAHFQGMPFTSPGQVAFSSSTDGGLAWSDPIRIDRTPPNSPFALEQAFIPSVEISDDGTIGVTYYNLQNDTPGDSKSDTDYWFIHCHPDSADCTDRANWSDSLRLTPESFDYLRAPVWDLGSNNELFLADYVGLTSLGSDFFSLFSVTTEDDPANAIFVPIRAR